MVIIVILGAVGALVLSWIIINAKAMRIVKIHSYDLERATGIPADQIYQEMIKNQLTPGEWALMHGLDPMTFQRNR